QKCCTLALCAALVCSKTSAQKLNARRRSQQETAHLRLTKLDDRKPRNVIFILTDDQRYDAMGFLRGQPFLETPNLDRLAHDGVHLRNAFVTTALCSPSRASILTGQYAHRHRVVDNDSPVPPGLIFFPQYLQRAGYETAFIGKWHMGGPIDDPQPGFDHWVSFKGQGSYLPDENGLNVDGKRVPQKGYITDELNSYALDWLKQRPRNKSFMLYLSHKAVHADFIPAQRHRGRYSDKEFVPPPSMKPENVQGAPMWVRNQRNSWHGVDFPYHSDLNIAEYYKRYAETLLAVDEGVGHMVELLKQKGMLDSTLILLMGDNGFAFGEHGLIDKRTAYEESMRVPLVMQCPELFRGSTVVNEVVANIDIAPTILEAAGLKPPNNMDGQSFLPLAQGKQVTWRDHLLYEYYWEWAFPHTPTIYALRGDRYKYIHYYGLWDINELYDIQADPKETRNLISSPEHQEVVRNLRREMFDLLERSNGLSIPVKPVHWGQQNLRQEGGSKAAEFPPQLIKRTTGNKRSSQRSRSTSSSTARRRNKSSAALSAQGHSHR
ncbi:MAG TPA: sulfatase, partial [Pyrinomonadaceae bacterium]|nr:sulfatase [Pyrinomonadaceae bacterium]